MEKQKKGLRPESQNPIFKSCTKDNKFKAEKRKVYSLLLRQKTPLTALQISEISNIRIQNVTRYIAKLKKQDKIIIAKYGICPLSKRSNVQFLTSKS